MAKKKPKITTWYVVKPECVKEEDKKAREALNEIGFINCYLDGEWEAIRFYTKNPTTANKVRKQVELLLQELFQRSCRLPLSSCFLTDEGDTWHIEYLIRTQRAQYTQTVIR